MTELRVALVGFGSMGQNHARVLQSLSGVNLVSIVDPQKAGLYWSGLHVTSTLDQALDSGIDYAVVATPTSTHLPICLRLAEDRIPTLVEKPLALNVEDAEKIEAVFRQTGTKCAAGHIERFNAAMIESKKRIEDGIIGQMLQIATRRQSHYPSRVGDVGVVLDLASHDIDSTLWLTGSNYSSLSTTGLAQFDLRREDLVSVTAKLDSGVVVNHLVNWLSPIKERKFVILGEEGSLEIDSLTSDLTFFAHGHVQTQWNYLANIRGPSEGEITRFSFVKPEPLLTEHENFRDYVLGRSDQVVSLDSALNVMRVAELILTSLAAQNPAEHTDRA